jgi:hypothetical protein
MTDCQCTEQGWCERHKCHKTANLVKLCQNRQDYFDLWETGHGPAQKINGEVPDRTTKPERDARLIEWLKLFAIESDRGVGDIVERMLSKVGGRAIKNSLKRLGVSCGCTNKQEALNRKYPL